jgi:hypothetical protein
MSKVRSGGGIQMNKVVQKRESTREKPVTRAVSPAGAAQQGNHFGNHADGRTLSKEPKGAEPLYSGGRSFQPVKLGNELATNVAGGGPGAGRTVRPSGGQGMHGVPAPGEMRSPRPGSRDTLAEYGPDKPNMPRFKGRT